MATTPSRRDLLKAVGVASLAGLAGCGESDSEATETDDGNGGTSGPTDAFSYTFEEGDDVVSSSLNSIEFNYPDGSAALSEASVASATLGGADVTGDISDTDILNQGDTLVVEFGGEYSIAAGDELAVELADVATEAESYVVDVTVNLQSGGTTFFQSF